jgi:hypothetical protein
MSKIFQIINSKVANYINICLSILLLLLPISNPLGQFLIHVLKFNLNILLWKELIMISIITMMVYSLIYNQLIFKAYFSIIWVVFTTLVTISSFYNQIALNSYLIGFRFELLWVLFLAISLDWVRLIGLINIRKLINSIYLGFGLSGLLTLATVIFGSQKVLTLLGYQDAVETTSNLVNSSLCHSINGLGDGCRLSGGFGNPNHYGAYLAMLLPLFIFNIKKGNTKLIRSFSFIFASLSVLFIILNFARFAWLGLIISLFIYLCTLFRKPLSRILVVSVLFFSSVGGFVLFSQPFDSEKYSFLPQYITKPGSSIGHYRLTNIAMEIITKNSPNIIFTGYGLGQSGPAAKPDYTDVKELKIVKENYLIADKYYTIRETITIPESWYLQLILNGGFIYAILYMLIVLAPLYLLIKSNNNTVIAITLGLFIVIFGNIFLHIWESSIVAIYYSILSILAFSYHNNHSYHDLDNSL